MASINFLISFPFSFFLFPFLLFLLQSLFTSRLLGAWKPKITISLGVFHSFLNPQHYLKFHDRTKISPQNFAIFLGAKEMTVILDVFWSLASMIKSRYFSSLPRNPCELSDKWFTSIKSTPGRSLQKEQWIKTLLFNKGHLLCSDMLCIFIYLFFYREISSFYLKTSQDGSNCLRNNAKFSRWY